MEGLLGGTEAEYKYRGKHKSMQGKKVRRDRSRRAGAQKKSQTEEKGCNFYEMKSTGQSSGGVRRDGRERGEFVEMSPEEKEMEMLRASLVTAQSGFTYSLYKTLDIETRVGLAEDLPRREGSLEEWEKNLAEAFGSYREHCAAHNLPVALPSPEETKREALSRYTLLSSRIRRERGETDSLSGGEMELGVEESLYKSSEMVDILKDIYKKRVLCAQKRYKRYCWREKAGEGKGEGYSRLSNTEEIDLPSVCKRSEWRERLEREHSFYMKILALTEESDSSMPTPEEFERGVEALEKEEEWARNPEPGSAPTQSVLSEPVPGPESYELTTLENHTIGFDLRTRSGEGEGEGAPPIGLSCARGSLPLVFIPNSINNIGSKGKMEEAESLREHAMEICADVALTSAMAEGTGLVEIAEQSPQREALSMDGTFVEEALAEAEESFYSVEEESGSSLAGEQEHKFEDVSYTNVGRHTGPRRPLEDSPEVDESLEKYSPKKVKLQEETEANLLSRTSPSPGSRSETEEAEETKVLTWVQREVLRRNQEIERLKREAESQWRPAPEMRKGDPREEGPKRKSSFKRVLGGIRRLFCLP
jgi:hypothetical protein